MECKDAVGAGLEFAAGASATRGHRLIPNENPDPLQRADTTRGRARATSLSCNRHPNCGRCPRTHRCHPCTTPARTPTCARTMALG